MRSGRLRRRIAVERATETQNEYNEPEETWRVLATVWAKVEPLKGAERYGSDVTQGEQQVALTFRWGSEIKDLTPKDRATRGTTIYDFIDPVNVGERNREFRVIATVRYG